MHTNPNSTPKTFAPIGSERTAVTENIISDPIVVGAADEAGPLTIDMACDATSFDAAVEELRLGLESADVLERFPKGLLADLESACSGGGVGELCELGAVTAAGAGQFTIDIRPGRLIERAITALRALRTEMQITGHGGSCVES